MPAPKVSVLIPVYNGAAFLAACLDSVLAQDFADCEILVSDDGSTDDSPAIIARYAARDARIRWWRNARNLGLAGNFNHCLREAKGEYIKFVLQDDLLLTSTAVRQMAAILNQHPEVSLIGSASRIIDEHSRARELRDHFPAGLQDGREAIMRCLETANLIGEPSVVMFRRAQAARGFDSRLPQLLDLDMWFRLLDQGQFAYLAQPLCAFRRHPGQQTNVNRRNRSDDGVLLITSWYAKPWVRASMTRRALFRQIHDLRRHPGAEAESLAWEMMCSLGRGWYTVFFLRWKISRPIEKLIRKLKLLKISVLRFFRPALPHGGL